MDSNSEPGIVADIFLQMVQISLNNMRVDPLKAFNYLDCLIDHQNYLCKHFHNPNALMALQQKVNELEVEEYPE